MAWFWSAALSSPVQPWLWSQVRLLTRFPVLFLNPICSLNYTWINQDHKSVHLPALTYIVYVMMWVQNLLDDENVFPTKFGTSRFSRMLAVHTNCPYRARLSAIIQPSNTSTASFFTSSHIHTMRTIHSFCTFVLSPTLTRSLPIFWHLAGNELLDIKDVKGAANAPVEIGALWEKWREMGILEG